MGRRVVPGNAQQVTVTVFGPGDRWSTQAASIGIMTNTRSPAASGTPYSGDRGFGLNGNRWTGATSYPYQRFNHPPAPIAMPQTVGVGLGSGVSGQPGLPSSGGLTGLRALAFMSQPPGGKPGFGG
jgi:hypothetical protein